ncbi:Low-affinity iron/zinc ion transport protein fet4 [Erysiphe necator]|uniref:Putative low affinity iron transporter n=1 Tax=Uncinula necator TaxID=52586 RepID=A0A0B1P588_UNCNE|nr:Low-affinity iron/zinc ion transport protein fet4 [Erysiphe necator]KHJ32111.1 putative low affinity iron transporter [Erysiphe necator]
MTLLNIWKSVKRSTFPERTPIFATAHTQNLTEEEVQKARYLIPLESEKDSFFDYQELSKASDTSSFREPNAFDKITIFAGSSATFFVILGFVGIWGFIGALYGPTDTWQIMFQNASSIQVYIMDILLIRQQQNSSRAMITRLAEFSSRYTTLKRLLSRIPKNQEALISKQESRLLKINSDQIDEILDQSAFVPMEKSSRITYYWVQACQVIARSLGSLYTFFLYWIGIGIWMILGPSLKFSDTWQLYINTATALALTFTSVFLQNIQQREEEKHSRFLEQALKIDSQIEKRLRLLTGDQKPNSIFSIPEPERTRTERINDFLADVMGSGLGVLISLTFVAVWISIGPTLKFNDNWWLIIGSFTGLVGFVDGFVLRSLYYREERFVKERFLSMATEDQLLFDQIEVSATTPEEPKRSFTDTVSLAISNGCGHRYAPPGAIAVVVALLITATVMSWSITGQLLCNTPTMIIEGFLLIVLIHAHNYANNERRADFTGLLIRRLHLLGFVEMLE